MVAQLEFGRSDTLSDRHESPDNASVDDSGNPGEKVLASSPQPEIVRKIEEFAELEGRFHSLVDKWREAHDPASSFPTDWIMSLPYQQIIGLGPDAIPFLLRELETQPDHWFWALRVLTDADPVSPESRGQFDEMVSAWLKWGRDNNWLSA